MNKGQIWLIGGTRDSVAIASLLLREQIPFVVSVVRDSARHLYPQQVSVAIGAMDKTTMESFCRQESIIAVIDASHPHAVQVSQQAIAVTAQLHLPYLRYERESVKSLNGDGNKGLITELDSFATLINHDYLSGQQVLLTLGCKALGQFQRWQDRATLYARILPHPESLEMALAAGFTSDRLIALRPPISQDLERALWQQWRISLVVTKASGTPGGEDIKRQLALELNIPLIVIPRPPITYPQQTSTLEEIIIFCYSLVLR